jgi:glycosyltransferase involved in cell wall biosynthesis
MKVAVFSICHNEETFLPYFFRHYKSFADHIVILDNHSTDGSFKICEQEANHVEKLDSDGLHRIDLMTSLKNSYWKSLKDFDWVFIVDIDEIVYHPNMLGFLENAKEQGCTVLKPTAYQMICDAYPTGDGQITEIMPYGVLSTEEVCQAFLTCNNFDKKCVISPKDIVETNYGPGAHYARMAGRVKELADPDLKLLHYRLLGLDYLLSKNRMRAKRLIAEKVAEGSSVHYLKSEEELTEAFQKYLSEKINVR